MNDLRTVKELQKAQAKIRKEINRAGIARNRGGKSSVSTKERKTGRRGGEKDPSHEPEGRWIRGQADVKRPRKRNKSGSQGVWGLDGGQGRGSSSEFRHGMGSSSSGPPNHLIKKFQTNLQKVSENIPLNRNMNFETAMPWMDVGYKAYFRNGEECMRMTGTEYVTELEIETTAGDPPNPLATLPGSTLYVLPIAPRYLPGTRLKKMSDLFQKFKFLNLTFELIPVVPATQNGALLGYVANDPEENFSLLGDQDMKLRAYMAHHGCTMWNAYNYGRISYTDDQTFGEYFTGEAEDARLQTQGLFIVAAASTFSPFDGTSASISLCQVVLHYDIELCIRKLEEATLSAESFILNPQEEQWQNVFRYADANEPVSFLSSFCDAHFPSIDKDVDQVFIMRTIERWTSSDDTAVPIPVDTVFGNTYLFDIGSVWYGRWKHYGGDVNLFSIYPSIGAALEHEEDTTVFLTTHGNEGLVNGALEVTIYNLELS